MPKEELEEIAYIERRTNPPSVTDLPDGGASHFAETIRKTKAKYAPLTPFSRSRSANCLSFRRAPHILIEALTGDFQLDIPAIHLVAQSGLDVYAHNMETVESRTPFVRDPRAKYRQSLEVLRQVKVAKPEMITKTSIMLGVGETDEEVLQTLKGEFSLRLSGLLGVSEIVC